MKENENKGEIRVVLVLGVLGVLGGFNKNERHEVESSLYDRNPSERGIIILGCVRVRVRVRDVCAFSCVAFFFSAFET